jgi:hypothetical protein
MGVRGGRFHRRDRSLGLRRWTSRRWICCLTSFRGRRLEVWGPRYTQLFFMDEVTAFAAGHRPCAECRREAFRAYREAVGAPGAEALDHALDEERRRGRERRLHWRRMAELPDGAVIAQDGRAFALKDGRWLAWSRAGWRVGADRPRGLVATLTPPTTLAALAGGYRPVWGPGATPAADVEP